MQNNKYTHKCLDCPAEIGLRTKRCPTCSDKALNEARKRCNKARYDRNKKAKTSNE